MKKNIVLFCFLTLNISVFAQVIDRELINFKNMKYSLLVLFGEQIVNDLAIEGYRIPKLPLDSIHQFVGYTLVCEVYFTPKCSYIFAFFNSTDALIKRFSKQGNGFRIRQGIYIRTFIHYIEDNNKLPNYIIESFRYQFITPYEGYGKDYAIYGDYKFKLKEYETFEIIDKKIEILQGEDAISRKYYSNF